jgi:radical SAM superfamily enzyme YgiQ (UPF0313 family)
MSLNQPQFRPPAEQDSVLIQMDVGCPFNGCAFCGMYKHLPHEKRAVESILKIIRQEARAQPDARRVFLADGDAFSRSVSDWDAVLEALNAAFPRLSRVNVYATGRSIAAKSPADLARFKAKKLNTLYLGLESGDEETLRRMLKGETAAHMIQAAQLAQSAGLKISVMILLGLGGREQSLRHARATASALNQMQPRLLSALRVVPVPGTPLFKWVEDGLFQLPTEYAIVQELRELVAHLALESTVFRANHSSNIIPLEGRFPQDQNRLLAELDQLLASHTLDTQSPGPLPFWL